MIEGMDEVRERFSRSVRNKKFESESAVTRLAMAILENAAPRIPVAEGNLINSDYKIVKFAANGFSGEVGYNALYAAFVHDAPGKLLGQNVPRHPPSLGVVWGPGGEPEFLKNAGEDVARFSAKALLRAEYR